MEQLFKRVGQNVFDATRGFIIILITILMCSVSCKEDQTPLVIIISQIPQVDGTSGEFIVFDVELVCEENITSFRVDQFHPKHGTTNVFDSVPPQRKFKYYYKVPFFEDSSLVTLTFSAASNSHFNSIPRIVLVSNKEQPLVEFAGNVFYSNLSGKPNAFEIKDLQSVFYDHQSSDKPDFADNSIDSVHLNALSREWISPSGLLFSKLNDFNYALASEKSVKDAFASAAKYNTVKNLSSDDVLVFGNNTEAKGTLRFTQIIDADSTLDDRYIFNVKLIE